MRVDRLRLMVTIQPHVKVQYRGRVLCDDTDLIEENLYPPCPDDD